MAEQEKRPPWRPPKYKPEYVDRALDLCERGARWSDLASEFGVAISTVRLWATTYPDFSAAIKDGKEKADELVERALYERAVGYECDETDIRVVNGEIVLTPIRKHYPPDTTAGIFWLKNRQKAKWRDVSETKHGGEIAVKKSVHDMSLDELLNIAAAGRAGNSSAPESEG